MPRQFGIRTLILATALVAIVVSATIWLQKPTHIYPTAKARSLANTFVASSNVADVNAKILDSLSAPYAVVFLNVQWSMQSELGKLQFAQFMLDHHRHSPKSLLEYKFVDITPITNDYSPLKALPGWARLLDESGRGSLLAGMGEIAWLEHGRVIHVQPIDEFKSTQELTRKTNKLIPNAG